MKDCRDGKFLLVWREGGQKKYSDYILTLPEAIRAKEQKELYLASLAKGLKVEDPSEGKTRLTIAVAIDEFLGNLTGRGNTGSLYVQNLRQFQHWNSVIAKAKKTFVDQIDRNHIMAFKKFLETDVDVHNDEYTAAWKCIRVNKMIKTVLKLTPGKGPVKKSDFSDVLNRKPVVTTYHKGERDKFLAVCEGVKLIVWTLFLKCGLRLKELSHLEWTDIDFVRRIVRIDRKKVKDGDNAVDFIPKKWSIRDIAIPSDLMALLEQLRAKGKSNLCFPTRTGRINTRLWDQCKGIARRAGVDAAKFMPKNFRSTRDIRENSVFRVLAHVQRIHIPTLVCADAEQIPLPDRCVQTCVTSPPYWQARKYAGKQDRVWSGDTECDHRWGNEKKIKQSPERDHAPTGGFASTRGTEPARRGMAFEASQGVFAPLVPLGRDHMGSSQPWNSTSATRLRSCGKIAGY